MEPPELTATLTCSPGLFFVHVLRIICVLHLGLTFCAGEMTNCQEFPCENSNACEEAPASAYNNNTSGSSYCVCRGKWAGLRCEVGIKLRAQSIQSEHVILKVEGEEDSRSFADLSLRELTISVWNLNRSDECSMTRRNQTTPSLTVEGLERSQEYVFCIANGHYNLCAFLGSGTANYSLESNCVYIQTKAVDDSVLDIFLIIVPCAGALFLLILAIFLYAHRHSLLLQLCLNYCCCRSCYCCRKHFRRQRMQMRKQKPEHNDILMPPDMDINFEQEDGLGIDTLLPGWRSRGGSFDQQEDSFDYSEDWPVVTDQDMFLLDDPCMTSSGYSQPHSDYTTQTYISDQDIPCATSQNMLSDLSNNEIFTTAHIDNDFHSNFPVHSNTFADIHDSDQLQILSVPTTTHSFFLPDQNRSMPMYQYQLCYPQNTGDELISDFTSGSTSGPQAVRYSQTKKRLRRGRSRHATHRPHSAGDFFPVNVNVNSGYPFASFMNTLHDHNAVFRPVSMGPTIGSANARDNMYIDSTFGISPFRVDLNRSNQEYSVYREPIPEQQEPAPPHINRFSYYSDVEASALDTFHEGAENSFSSHTLPRMKKIGFRTPIATVETSAENNEQNENNFSYNTLPTSPRFDRVGHKSPPKPEHLSLQALDLSPGKSSQNGTLSHGAKSGRRRVKKLIHHFENASLLKNGRGNKRKGEDSIEEEFRDLQSPLSEERKKVPKNSSFFRANPKPKLPTSSIPVVPSYSSENPPRLREHIFRGHPSQHVIPPFSTDDDDDDDDNDNSCSHGGSGNHNDSSSYTSFNKNEDNYDDDGNDVSFSDSTSLSTFTTPEAISSYDDDTRNLVTPFCTGDSTSDDAEDFSDEEGSCLRASTDTLKNEDTSHL